MGATKISNDHIDHIDSVVTIPSRPDPIAGSKNNIYKRLTNHTLLALTLRHRSLPDWSSAYGRSPKSDTTVDMVDTVDMIVGYFSSTDFSSIVKAAQFNVQDKQNSNRFRT